MTHRSPARYLAPLALVGFAVALLIVVSSSRNDEVPVTPSTTVQRASGTDGAPKKSAAKTKKKDKKAATRTYIVEAGDTPLGIAEKTGVPLETIEQLNPDLDPQGLNVGDEITLR
jgi:LysM repeat protein